MLKTTAKNTNCLPTVRLCIDSHNVAADQTAALLPLVLLSTPLRESVEQLAALQCWLQQLPELELQQSEQGADWLQIRFYFRRQPFYLHYEHYSDCYWIDADSKGNTVLLSQLAEVIQSFEQNHMLS